MTINIKEYTLEKITVGGTWKVWLQRESGDLVCVAVFLENTDAHLFKEGLVKDGNEAIVTRSSTILIECVDETE